MYFFSVNGFGNALAFQTIEDSDISSMEKFMRTNDAELSNVVENKKDLYGETFAANPKKFQFRPGDKKIIHELVRHVKQVIDSSSSVAEGLAHFNTKCKINEIKIQQNEEQKVYHECNKQTHYFLHKLLSATDRNSSREKGGYRYDDDIKLFSAYLRTLVGGCL